MGGDGTGREGSAQRPGRAPAAAFIPACAGRLSVSLRVMMFSVYVIGLFFLCFKLVLIMILIRLSKPLMTEISDLLKGSFP